MLGAFSLLDWLIIGGYFVAVLAVGLWKSRGETNSESFVVGNRQVPWLAVLASIVATEISAATFIGVPAVGFGENLNYLQFGIGSLVARFVVAYVFLGVFYALGVLTVYEYLGKRFGPGTRYSATGFFLIGRVLASAARLYIATFALAAVFDVPLWASLALFTVTAIIYTYAGGIRAIIWTDTIQACVFISSGIAVIVFLQVEVGWGELLATARDAGKLELFRLRPEGASLLDWINDPMLLYVALLSGFLGTTAALGADQDLTQRMLTCKNVRLARRSVILSGFTGIPVAAVFLFIGIGLYGYFLNIPIEDLPWGTSQDYRLVLPYFIQSVLPVGLKGLLVAGIFATAMSSIDSALGALSSSTVVDLYRPLVRQNAPESHYLAMCRVFVIVFGIMLPLIAWLMREEQDMLWLALKVTSIPAGSLLGVFLLGLLTQRGSDKWSVIAMVSSAIVSSILLWMTETGLSPLAWSWVILIGATSTIVVGAAGRALPETGGRIE